MFDNNRKNIKKGVKARDKEKYFEAVSYFQKVDETSEHYAGAQEEVIRLSLLGNYESKNIEETSKWMKEVIEHNTLRFMYNAIPFTDIFDLLIDEDDKVYWQQQETGWQMYLEATKHLQNQEYEEAITYYEQVPASFISYQSVLGDKMGALVNCDRNEQALNLFKSIHTSCINYDVALLNAQAAYNNLEQYDDALDAFNKISKTVHFYNYAVSNAIRSAIGKKDYDKLYELASNDYEQTESEESLYYMGLALYYKGKYEAVITLLEVLNDEDDDTGCAMCADYEKANTLYLLGLCYKLLGNEDKCEDYYDEVRTLANSGVSASIQQADGSTQMIREGYVRAFRPDQEGKEYDGFFEIGQ